MKKEFFIKFNNNLKIKLLEITAVFISIEKAII